MKKNLYFINILHTGVVALFCLAGIFIRTFSVNTVLPRITITFMVMITLIPMVLEYYMVSERDRDPFISMVFGGLAFTILPACSSLTTGIPLWKLMVAGTVVFGVTDLLYRSIGERISSGSYSRLAPAANAVMLYLASQCLQGLL